MEGSKMPSMSYPRRIEGYAIVSTDGMLANDAGVMPGSLIVEADQLFFEQGLNGVAVVVHGRHSHERQSRSHLRHRLILTRHVAATAADPSDDKALFWNPAGASFEHALDRLGAPDGSVGVIGGTNVFDLFLDRYDVFYLSQVRDVWLPGGRPIFSEVPARTPEDVLAGHGLHPTQRQALDPAKGVELVGWERSPKRA
jgi:dihydrofolate reductase